MLASVWCCLSLFYQSLSLNQPLRRYTTKSKEVINLYRYQVRRLVCLLSVQLITLHPSSLSLSLSVCVCLWLELVGFGIFLFAFITHGCHKCNDGFCLISVMLLRITGNSGTVWGQDGGCHLCSSCRTPLRITALLLHFVLTSRSCSWRLFILENFLIPQRSLVSITDRTPLRWAGVRHELFLFYVVGGATSGGMLMYPGAQTVVLPVQGAAGSNLLKKSYVLNITNASDLKTTSDATGRCRNYHHTGMYRSLWTFRLLKDLCYINNIHTCLKQRFRASLRHCLYIVSLLKQWKTRFSATCTLETGWYICTISTSDCLYVTSDSVAITC